MAQMVKHLPAMQATRVQSLGWEDPLEKEMTPVFLSGESHRQRSSAGYSPWVPKESFTFQTEEGRGGRREMIGEEEET